MGLEKKIFKTHALFSRFRNYIVSPFLLKRTSSFISTTYFKIVKVGFVVLARVEVNKCEKFSDRQTDGQTGLLTDGLHYFKQENMVCL